MEEKIYTPRTVTLTEAAAVQAIAQALEEVNAFSISDHLSLADISYAIAEKLGFK